jgi:hypothetical protein
MGAPLKKVSLEELRARYTELLRLRERVERLENLRDGNANPIGAAYFVQEAETHQ